jgi:hypothetical protein
MFKPIDILAEDIPWQTYESAKLEANEVNRSKDQGFLNDSHRKGAGTYGGILAQKVAADYLGFEEQKGSGLFSNDLIHPITKMLLESKNKDRAGDAKHWYDAAVRVTSTETQDAKNYIFTNSQYESKIPLLDNNGKRTYFNSGEPCYEYHNLIKVQILGWISREDFDAGKNKLVNHAVWKDDKKEIVTAPMVRLVKAGEVEAIDQRSPNHEHQFKIRHCFLKSAHSLLNSEISKNLNHQDPIDSLLI